MAELRDSHLAGGKEAFKKKLYLYFVLCIPFNFPI